MTHNDVERLFDRLADDRVDEALRERLKVQDIFIKGGGLQASRYPVTVEDVTRKILRKAVSDSMQLLTDIVSRKELPFDNVKGPALSRTINIAHRLANLVDEANRHMPTLDMLKIRGEYEKIVDHGISDFEVGMIDGKPAKPSQNFAVHIGGDNVGTVQIGGDAAHQAVIQVQHGIDLTVLAKELSLLRVELRKDATEASQDIALGQLAQAEEAAKAGHGEGTVKALGAIGKTAGKWIVDTGTKIGTTVAADYLKRHLGL